MTLDEHAACRRAVADVALSARADALVALAAEFDQKARYWHEKASHEATAPDAAIGRAYEGAARLARQRARGGQGEPSSTSPVSREGCERQNALSASQAASYQDVVELIRDGKQP